MGSIIKYGGRGFGKFNIVLSLMTLLAIYLVNWCLYYFIIIPFGFIYGISRVMQIVIVGAIFLTSNLIFISLLRQNAYLGPRGFEFGIGLKRGREDVLIIKKDVSREAEVLLEEMKHQIETDNVGAVDDLYSRLLDLAKTAKPGQRAKLLHKCNDIEVQIGELKKKYNL